MEKKWVISSLRLYQDQVLFDSSFDIFMCFITLLFSVLLADLHPRPRHTYIYLYNELYDLPYYLARLVFHELQVMEEIESLHVLIIYICNNA